MLLLLLLLFWLLLRLLSVAVDFTAVPAVASSRPLDAALTHPPSPPNDVSRALSSTQTCHYWAALPWTSSTSTPTSTRATTCGSRAVTSRHTSTGGVQRALTLSTRMLVTRALWPCVDSLRARSFCGVTRCTWCDCSTTRLPLATLLHVCLSPHSYTSASRHTPTRAQYCSTAPNPAFTHPRYIAPARDPCLCEF